MRVAHEIPLPTQVVKLFRELHMLTGGGTLCFPGRHSASQCITDMALLNAIRRMGFGKDEMTVHGFRAMFSTLLNENKLDWGWTAILLNVSLPIKSKTPFGVPITTLPTSRSAESCFRNGLIFLMHYAAKLGSL